MNKFPFLISLMLALTPSALPASAEDGVQPPPTEVHDTEEGRETIETDSGDTNLNRELSAPEKLPEGTEVHSYTRQDDGAQITEYSMHGRVYMIKVQPAGDFPPYYLYDRNGDGTMVRLPGGYKRPSPPMWIIKKF